MLLSKPDKFRDLSTLRSGAPALTLRDRLDRIRMLIDAEQTGDYLDAIAKLARELRVDPATRELAVILAGKKEGNYRPTADQALADLRAVAARLDADPELRATAEAICSRPLEEKPMPKDYCRSVRCTEQAHATLLATAKALGLDANEAVEEAIARLAAEALVG